MAYLNIRIWAAQELAIAGLHRSNRVDRYRMRGIQKLHPGISERSMCTHLLKIVCRRSGFRFDAGLAPEAWALSTKPMIRSGMKLSL